MGEVKVHRIGVSLLVMVTLLTTTTTTDNGNDSQPVYRQERALKLTTLSKANNYFKNSPYTSGIGDLSSASISGIGKLATLDTNKPTAELVKDIGNAMVPMISMGLALIPGVGPLISGIFSGIWDLATGFFGEPQKSPLEKVVEYMESEFKAVREDMKKMREEILKSTEEMMDKKVGKLMATILNGEVDRNKYICDKYAIVSKKLSHSLQKKIRLTEVRRLETMMYLHDCDNFLRDTEAAFLHTDMADVIWIPAVITTLARVAFLTEVISYGPVLEIEKVFLVKFFNAYKTTIRNHFAFYKAYTARRLYSLPKKDDLSESVYGNFTPEEYETCRMQGELLYLDRELYPYGVPRKTVIGSITGSKVDLTSFKMATNETRHVQVFYDGLANAATYDQNNKLGITVVNCFMGPVVAQLVEDKFSVRVTYATDKSYEIRVLYFHELESAELKPKMVMNQKVPGIDYFHEDISDADVRAQVTHAGDSNNIAISFREEADSKQRQPAGRFVYDASYYQAKCNTTADVQYRINRYDCRVNANYYAGRFVIETLEPFTIPKDKSGKKVEGEISVSMNSRESINFVGLEFIMFPLV